MPLAHAFLALSDDGAEPRRRSPALAVAAAAAVLALSVGMPLGWLAGHPVATLGSKVAVVDGEAA